MQEQFLWNTLLLIPTEKEDPGGCSGWDKQTVACRQCVQRFFRRKHKWYCSVDADLRDIQCLLLKHGCNPSCLECNQSMPRCSGVINDTRDRREWGLVRWSGARREEKCGRERGRASWTRSVRVRIRFQQERSAWQIDRSTFSQLLLILSTGCQGAEWEDYLQVSVPEMSYHNCVWGNSGEEMRLQVVWDFFIHPHLFTQSV